MIELAKDELENLTKVWVSIFVSLSYCYVIGKITQKGFTRLVAILPIILLFLVLPLNLTSIHFCGLTSFFISWLANFKLLLFAFGKPPLCVDPPISFPLFILVACLPIKIQNHPPPKNSPKQENNQNPDQISQNNSYPRPKNSPFHQNNQNPDQKPQNISHPSSQNNQNPDQNSQNNSYPSPTNPQIQQNNQNPDQKPQNNSHPSPKNQQIHQNHQNPDQKPQNNSHPSPKNQQIQQNNQNPDQNPKIPQKSPWNYLTKSILLILMIQIYNYSNKIHPKLLWLIYFFHIYFALEITLAILAKSTNFFLNIELEPQFNEPLLSTSLQDFWGKRWNLMVTSILRPTVYFPTLNLFNKFLKNRKTAALPAVMATFIVSAIMHEIIFYYLGRVGPTFEVTWFFLLHGFCLCVEIMVKEYGRERKWWVPPRWLSGGVTAVFVVGSGFWLFLPPLLNAGLDTRGLGEYAVVSAFVRRVVASLN